MPSVKVDFDNLPKGRKVTIPGLGKFVNGETTEVKQRTWDIYLKTNPRAATVVKGDTLEVGTKATTEQNKKAQEVQEVLDDDTQSLDSLNREQLDELAVGKGLDPKDYSNKKELVAALEDNGQEAN